MKTVIKLQIGYLLSKKFNLPTDGLDKKFPILNRAWKKQENKILHGLEKITGLRFLQNYVDVFLVNPDDSPSISNPIIVAVKDDADRFIRVLSHELIHELCADNTTGINWHFKVQKMYKKEAPQAANHVMVHAILEALYMDILKKPKEILKDIETSQKSENYKRAWEIVKKEGYKNIIASLKSPKKKK